MNPTRDASISKGEQSTSKGDVLIPTLMREKSPAVWKKITLTLMVNEPPLKAISVYFSIHMKMVGGGR